MKHLLPTLLLILGAIAILFVFWDPDSGQELLIDPSITEETPQSILGTEGIRTRVRPVPQAATPTLRGEIPSIQISGTVVDETGIPVPEVVIFCRPLDRAGEKGHSIRADLGGMFAGEVPRIDATYMIEAGSPYELIEVKRVNGSVDWESLQLVVRGSYQHIPVVVLDVSRRPVEGAGIHISGRTFSFLEGHNTDADGAFTLVRRPDEPEEFLLEVKKDGYAPLQPNLELSWAVTTDAPIEIILHPLQGIEILVTEAESGERVLEYGLRLALARQAMTVSTVRTAAITDQGLHPEGMFLLRTALPSGSIVVVEPADTRLFRTFHTVVADMQSGRIMLSVPLQSTLDCEVVDESGMPVQGARIELLHHLGQGLLPKDGRACPIEELTSIRDLRISACVVSEDTTDGRGIASLSAPRGQSIWARVSAPGHQSLQTQISLHTGDEFKQFRLLDGGIIRGKIEPKEFLEELFRLEHPPSSAKSWGQRIVLQARASQVVAIPSHTTDGLGEFRAGLSRVGEFDFTSLPRSTTSFDLYLRTMAGRGTSTRWIFLGRESAARDGGRRHSYDCSEERFGQLTGRVLVNGAILKNEKIRLLRTVTADDFRNGGKYDSTEIKTDVSGQFTIDRLVPGRYTVSFAVMKSNGRAPALLAVDEVDVLPGQPCSQTFAITYATNSLRVRLVSPGGEPIAGTSVYGFQRLQLLFSAKTDSKGWIDIDPCPQEGLILALWPPNLQNREKREEYQADHPSLDWTAPMLRFGRVIPGEGPVEMVIAF